MSTAAIGDHARRSASADGAAQIHDEGVGLWTWTREIDPELTAIAQTIADGPHLSVDTQTPVDECAVGVGQLLKDAGVPRGRGQALLLADICELIDLYARTVGTDRVKVRLDADPHRRCPKFHIDHVGARLLCTYTGPGTEWCDPESQDDVRRVEAGWVTFLKGVLHPTGETATVLHRSPAASAGSRLLLVVDDARSAHAH